MKKIIFIGSAFLSVLAAATAYAAQDINIIPPSQGYNSLGDFITNIIQLAFALALLLVLVMLIWGSFEWISSGGDKENVGKARGKIINALIGLAVLSIAFALATVGAQFLGFPNLSKITIPGPNNCKPPCAANQTCTPTLTPATNTTPATYSYACTP